MVQNRTVPKKQPKVMIGIPHTRTGWEPEMIKSLIGLTRWEDHFRPGRIAFPDDETPEGGLTFCEGTNLPMQRNNIVRKFLESGCDWLLFVDTDETFPPTLIEQFMRSASEEHRPIISGLVMARRDADKPISPACVIVDERGRFSTSPVVPNVRYWNVGAIGSGALFVHRKVYEAVAEAQADREPTQWYEYKNWEYVDDDDQLIKDQMGEDYVFSLRAQECGFPTIVDTSIQLGHIKPIVLTTEMFYKQNAGFGACPTFVVIPVKDRLDLTQNLVEQLREQGGWDGILIYDNGSKKETREWLGAQPDLLVYDAKDAGIHQMWNAGIEESLYRSGGRCNIAFLNNDLKLGHNFLPGLTKGLRDGQWVAVGPNYDSRDGEGVQQVRGICAERYDGTGGLPGFAFMVRGEWFASGYRFPVDCKWWYGDNDLTMMFDMHGAPYGIVGDIAVEHLGAGTAKDWNDPKWQKQLAADHAAWVERWKKLGVELAA